jgi:hypothetical protein
VLPWVWNAASCRTRTALEVSARRQYFELISSPTRTSWPPLLICSPVRSIVVP